MTITHTFSLLLFFRKWAQRTDCVYLTISLADVTDEKIGLTADKLSFSGTSGDGRKCVGAAGCHGVATFGSLAFCLRP
jgi:hypothetical protein